MMADILHHLVSTNPKAGNTRLNSHRKVGLALPPAPGGVPAFQDVLTCCPPGNVARKLINTPLSVLADDELLFAAIAQRQRGRLATKLLQPMTNNHALAHEIQQDLARATQHPRLSAHMGTPANNCYNTCIRQWVYTASKACQGRPHRSVQHATTDGRHQDFTP